MINIIACNMVLSNQSTYYHNYYMYHDINGGGKWEMMPWDLDKTLSVYSWRNHTYSSAPWAPDNPFLERAILNETIMADIKSRANEIFNEVFNTVTLWPMIDSLKIVLQSSVQQDTTDNIMSLGEWHNLIEIEKNHILSFPDKLNWYFDHVQSPFVAKRTPNVMPRNLTFKWTPSVDPDGQPVEYTLLLTTGYEFEPELTTTYAGIPDTFLTVQNIPEGSYSWKVFSTEDSGQEVEAFDSKNPLTVKSIQVLPGLITEDLDLYSENSPYFAGCPIIVKPSAKLTVNEGVTILFQNKTYLKIEGGFQVAGTKQNPVIFMPYQENGCFDSLVIINPTQAIHINYLNLIDGALYADNANIVVDHSNLILNNKHLVGFNVIYHHYFGNVTFRNSSVCGNHSGQGLEFGYCQSATIETSSFSNIDDPMELISITDNGYVTDNVAINSNDDGINFNNCRNLTISGNQLYNCMDNGISVGANANGYCENILIEKNLVVDCTTGIRIKDGSSAIINNNTVYNCETGIRILEEHQGWGGSRAQIVNTIISNSLIDAILTDSLSVMTIKYSLCDTEEFTGTGNIFDDPMFVSVSDANFTLIEGSPCINSGDPESQADPDGTWADIGAFYFNNGNYNVVLNEINYRSSPEFNTEDWVELCNVEEIPADISGWIFKDDNDDHIFEFPYGAIIPSGGYLVLCSNSGVFSENNPDIENYTGSFPFGLSSSGEVIRLYTKTGILVDSLEYGVESPWPEEPNGQGPTLELRNPFLDNTLAASWDVSPNYGTPGKVNSNYVSDTNETVPNTISLSVYPNPSTGWITVHFRSPSPGYLSIDCYDLMGNIILQVVKNNWVDGGFEKQDRLNLGQGVYILHAKYDATGIQQQTSQKIIIKP
nr:lamin tail domain-containing protein [Bacteroidota bacterium]